MNDITLTVSELNNLIKTLIDCETLVTLPSVSGIYFIRTTQGSETETHKVILL